LDSEFVGKALVKHNKRYVLVNAEGVHWPCKIRWSGRNNSQCYLTCEWKDFCNENGFKEDTIIQLGVDKDLSMYIHVIEIKI